MTREEAKKFLSIIEAWAEGKMIQYKFVDGWRDANIEPLLGDISKYRIKPEQKYRAFKTQEECWLELLKHQPFGWVKYGDSICSIQNIVSDNITITDYEELYSFDLNNSFKSLKFTDNTPFGIKEE